MVKALVSDADVHVTRAAAWTMPRLPRSWPLRNGRTAITRRSGRAVILDAPMTGSSTPRPRQGTEPLHGPCTHHIVADHQTSSPPGSSPHLPRGGHVAILDLKSVWWGIHAVEGSECPRFGHVTLGPCRSFITVSHQAFRPMLSRPKIRSRGGYDYERRRHTSLL